MKQLRLKVCIIVEYMCDNAVHVLWSNIKSSLPTLLPYLSLIIDHIESGVVHFS